MKTLLTFDQYATAVLCAALAASGCGGRVTDSGEDLPTEIPTERVTQEPDGGTDGGAEPFVDGGTLPAPCVETMYVLCQHPKERR